MPNSELAFLSPNSDFDLSDVPLAPSCVKAINVTSTSAVITWLPSNSNFQHVVAINSVEVKTLKASVFRHNISGNFLYKIIFQIPVALEILYCCLIILVFIKESLTP